MRDVMAKETYKIDGNCDGFQFELSSLYGVEIYDFDRGYMADIGKIHILMILKPTNHGVVKCSNVMNMRMREIY